jgi:hypothetical protein
MAKPPGGRSHHFGHEPNHHFSTGFTEPTHREAALDARSGITAGGRSHHFGAWVHHGRTASMSAELSTMNRTTTPRPNCSLSPSERRTPVEPTAAERRPECPAVHGTAGHSPLPTWWGEHLACPQRQRAIGIASAGSPCLGHGCVTSPSPPGRTERHCSEPAGLSLRSPFTRITLDLRVDDAESKIDVQYYWTWRPRRWPTPWACPRDGLGFAALGEKA